MVCAACLYRRVLGLSALVVFLSDTPLEAASAVVDDDGNTAVQGGYIEVDFSNEEETFTVKAASPLVSQSHEARLLLHSNGVEVSQETNVGKAWHVPSPGGNNSGLPSSSEGHAELTEKTTLLLPVSAEVHGNPGLHKSSEVRVKIPTNSSSDFGAPENQIVVPPRRTVTFDLPDDESIISISEPDPREDGMYSASAWQMCAERARCLYSTRSRILLPLSVILFVVAVTLMVCASYPVSLYGSFSLFVLTLFLVFSYAC